MTLINENIFQMESVFLSQILIEFVTRFLWKV